MKFPFVRKSAPAVERAVEPPRDGILFGYSEAPKPIPSAPEYVDPEALLHHSLVIGNAGAGKTTLLKVLAKAAMEREMSVVVIDADGDLAPALVGDVPPPFAKATTYFDLADSKHLVGLNLLDRATVDSDSQIVSLLVRAYEEFCGSDFGPVPEGVLRYALTSLLQANAHLAKRKQDQFTLLDLVPLLERSHFRHSLMRKYLDDFELIWWAEFYEKQLAPSRIDATRPLVAWVRSLADNTVLRSILVQSSSAINFRGLISKRGITFINLAHPALPKDKRDWIGDILAQLLALAVLGEKYPSDAPARGKLLVVLNGFKPVSLIDDGGVLRSLEDRAVGIVFSETALARLDRIKPGLTDELLRHVTNVFAFQTTAEDSKRLSRALFADLGPTNLVDLPFHSCYARIHEGDRMAQVKLVQTLPPAQVTSNAIRDRVLNQSRSHTRPVDEVERERREFEKRWYGDGNDLADRTTPPPTRAGCALSPRC
jgi:energy-coupling factor transporter ATP-binding protein EcfA2